MILICISGLQGDINKAHDILKGTFTKENTAFSDLNTLTIGFGFWAGIVTLALILIVTLIFKRMRSKVWSSSASVVSDAESGASVSDFNSEICSVVDVDILKMDPGNGKVNKGYEAYAEKPVLPSGEPSLEARLNNSHPELDTQINEHTIEALANLPADNIDVTKIHGKIATISGEYNQQFHHATFKGTTLSNKQPGFSES